MERDYKELYEKITESDWFKKAYQDKSLGKCPIVVEELEESKDEKIRKAIIDTLRRCNDGEKCLNDNWALTIDDVHTYLEKQKEQKPAEWSEEDEHNLQWIISCVKGTNVYTAHGLAKELTEWLKNKLKSLRPQPKQEWSEEDSANITDNKKFFLWIYNRLLYVYNEDPDIDYMHSFRKRIDQLFSKPHWKPSEEQIEALFTASERNDKLGSILNSLYYDLKKL